MNSDWVQGIDFLYKKEEQKAPINYTSNLMNNETATP